MVSSLKRNLSALRVQRSQSEPTTLGPEERRLCFLVSQTLWPKAEEAMSPGVLLPWKNTHEQPLCTSQPPWEPGNEGTKVSGPISCTAEWDAYAGHTQDSAAGWCGGTQENIKTKEQRATLDLHHTQKKPRRCRHTRNWKSYPWNLWNDGI